MIITLSGRKHSGKTVLSQILVNNNYEKISVASFLKEFCCDYFGWDISKMDEAEYKEEILNEQVLWDSTLIKKTAENLQLDYEKCNKEERVFKTRREALIFIGTNFLRHYDIDFHVKKMIEKINPKKNYVIDDIRFKNELEIIKNNYNSINIFILRPKNRIYINHESEIDLQWYDFDYIVVNSSHLKYLENLFMYFLWGLSKPKKISRDELKAALEKNLWDVKNTAKELGFCKSKVNKLILTYLIKNLNERMDYKIDHRAFTRMTEEESYWMGVLSADGCVKGTKSWVISLTSIDKILIEGFRDFLKTEKPITRTKKSQWSNNEGYELQISSRYIIENIKLWNLEPRKSKFNKVPDAILKNRNLIKPWIVGLIDGDGSVLNLKGSIKGKEAYQVFKITVLASKEIIDFIANETKHIGGGIYKEKKIENLYTLNFYSKKAIAFYKYLSPYCEMGLKRKWDKAKLFIENHKGFCS